MQIMKNYTKSMKVHMLLYKHGSVVTQNLVKTLQLHVQYMSIKVTIQYSNYSVVSLSHYSSSTVVILVLTVIGILVNSTPQ